LHARSRNPNTGRCIRFKDYLAQIDQLKMLIDEDIEEFEQRFDEDDRRLREIDTTLSALKSDHLVSPCHIPAYSC